MKRWSTLLGPERPFVYSVRNSKRTAFEPPWLVQARSSAAALALSRRVSRLFPAGSPGQAAAYAATSHLARCVPQKWRARVTLPARGNDEPSCLRCIWVRQGAIRLLILGPPDPLSSWQLQGDAFPIAPTADRLVPAHSDTSWARAYASKPVLGLVWPRHAAVPRRSRSRWGTAL